MTNEKAKLIGYAVGSFINLAIDIYVAYLLGHQFHSFAVGMSAYIVFSSLSGIHTKLTQIKEKN